MPPTGMWGYEQGKRVSRSNVAWLLPEMTSGPEGPDVFYV